MNSQGLDPYGIERDYPLLYAMAVEYDFADRLGRGCGSPLHDEADAALRELWFARRAKATTDPPTSSSAATEKDVSSEARWGDAVDAIREALTVPIWGSVERGYFESIDDLRATALAALDALTARHEELKRELGALQSRACGSDQA